MKIQSHNVELTPREIQTINWVFREYVEKETEDSFRAEDDIAEVLDCLHDEIELLESLRDIDASIYPSILTKRDDGHLEQILNEDFNSWRQRVIRHYEVLTERKNK